MLRFVFKTLSFALSAAQRLSAAVGARALPAPLALLCAGGCGDEGGRGTLAVSVYGEPFIEEGIPASAVDDGWSVRFSSFRVELRAVEVGGARLLVGRDLELAAPSGGEGVAAGSLALPSGAHPALAYELGALRVAGEARHEGRGEVRRFDWLLDVPTRYERCALGLSLGSGEEARAELTIHADHLLYDSLVAEEPGLLFGPLAAADADGDGEVTRAELEAASVGALDVGSGGEVGDLWAWLRAQARTVGHLNGEGHCDARALDAEGGAP